MSQYIFSFQSCNCIGNCRFYNLSYDNKNIVLGFMFIHGDCANVTSELPIKNVAQYTLSMALDFCSGCCRQDASEAFAEGSGQA